MVSKSPATLDLASDVAAPARDLLPSSGLLLGVLVEVFDLRRENEYLSGTTARRWLAGKWVRTNGQSRVIREVARDLQQRVGDPSEGGPELLLCAAVTWDGLRAAVSPMTELLESSGAPWAVPTLIVRGFIATRFQGPHSAVIRQDEPRARAGGIGSLLREWQVAGPRRISRDELSEGVGCALNTVDAWFDRGSLPKPVGIRRIAHFFGKHLDRAERQLAIALRLRSASIRLARWLGRRVPRRSSADAMELGGPRRDRAA